MKYKKITKKNFNLHIIQTDKYKTVFLKVNFKRKLKKEDISFRNMLINVLFESTCKYPSKRYMEIESEELYELQYRGSNYISGNYSIMGADALFLDPKYTEPSMLEESFQFLSEIIFHPNIDKTGFKKTGFDITRHTIDDYLVSVKENPDFYAQMRLLEEMEPNTVLSYGSCGYLEDIEKITRKELYQYYLDVLENDIIDIFVIGNVEEKEIESLAEKYFPFKNRQKETESHFYHSKNIRENVKFSSEKLDLKQSKLLMGCQIIGATDFELRYVLNVYNYILGGSPSSKLFQNVREKNSLCYSISSSSQPLVSVLTIRAGINSWEYDRACALILEQLEDIKNGKFSNQDIEDAITTYKSTLKSYEDSSESMISLYAGIEYLGADEIPNRIQKIESVDRESVLALANKIKLDTIFFLEGGEEHEEEPPKAF